MKAESKASGVVADGSIRTHARELADEVQRELVAEAVCRVIAAEGMDAASLRRVASELGCTTGLISHYFKSKEQLLIHALEHATREISTLVLTDLDGRRASTIDDYLRAYCSALPFEPLKMQYWRVLSAFRISALTNETLRDFFTEYGEAQSDHYRPLLAEAVGCELDDEIVVKLDLALDALLEGFGLAATELPDAFTPDGVYQAVNVALNAWIDQAADSVD